MSDLDPIIEQARTALREGIGRSRKMAAQAKVRLSELTSASPYAGPASLILADGATMEALPAETAAEAEAAPFQAALPEMS